MITPLQGITVVEFTGLGPAPLAGQLLADMGAQVIVVDRRSSALDKTDVNRRGKRSIAIDLKSDAGRQATLRLLETADVLIEGFRPGVMEGLGLGPQDVNEKLIYARMTGWGQQGPLAQTAGHDITYLALTGALNMFGSPDKPPHPPLNYVADFGGGTMFLVFGVLAALIERSRSGKGQVVDAAMVDGVAALSGLFTSLIARGMVGEHRGQNMLDGSAPFYRCYECADGKYIAVGCLEPQFFAEFLSRAGLPPEDSAKQMSRSYWPDMHKRYENHFKTRERDDWAEVFGDSDACVAPVLALSEASTHPHMHARGSYRTLNGIQHPMPAPRFNRSNSVAPSEPSAPGADGEAILAAVGFSEGDIDELKLAGVLK